MARLFIVAERLHHGGDDFLRPERPIGGPERVHNEAAKLALPEQLHVLAHVLRRYAVHVVAGLEYLNRRVNVPELVLSPFDLALQLDDFTGDGGALVLKRGKGVFVAVGHEQKYGPGRASPLVADARYSVHRAIK